MKKTIYIISSLFLTLAMQGQIIPQPKATASPTIKIGKSNNFELKNGLKVMVVENHKLPRVSFRLSLDNMPYAEGDKKGVADITSQLIGSGTTKTTKDAFNEEVDFLGANIGFDANGASASGLSKYSGRILELMADGALNTVFTQEEFDKIKAKMLEAIKSQEKSITAVAGRVENVLTFGVNHPSGEYLSAESINKVTLQDAVSNYKNNFVPGNAYLIIVGDVKTKEIKKVVEKLFGSWAKATAPQITYPDPKNVPQSQINFVDMPNAVQSEISVVNTVNLKITDKQYFAAILANQILGGGGEGRLFLNLREKHGWTYGAYSSIGYGKYVEKFRSSTSVRNAVTDSSVVEILNELKKIRTELVSADDLKNAKAKYIGNFVMQIQKPATVARYALNTETQNLPADFYENYIRSINAVTVEDIKAVANKYFLADNIRILVVGKGTEVAPALENLKMPMFYFDKFGNPIEKPVFKKDIPKDVTFKSVLDKYIVAIGGEKAVKAVKTISMKGSTTIPQAPSPLSFTSKADSKGKLNVELAMGTMSLMKQVVNETGAYVLQQGQRKNFEGSELAEMKSSAVLFEELNLSKKEGISLDGIENFNGKEAYAIKNGKNTLYYDVASGLKLAEAKTMEQGGKSITQTTNFGDYREVKGVKVPFNIIQNVGFELDIKMSEVTINEGVTDSDFK
ncbi:M16 family metallopeptidase [Flavobacterium granuli]|uniref:Zn-dependent peptidase n=1 Tax=Flavobacterium granuli TaxID=280093 RepID=A0A1M5MK92_9FLAO|nr:pitrilysin family protein [Flavobacterium granuli]PRZ24969.1 putative Zn-dependent peptidase [Flavobacterium granuli]SHG77183.1 Predicted Zn-dependent peptidase [Flavobacterium granuli]